MHAKNSVVVWNTRIAFKKARSGSFSIMFYYRLKLCASGV